MSYFNQVSFSDTHDLDALGRLRTSESVNVFDIQFVYNLAPLLLESITAGSGATVTHDTTNRNALMTFSSTPTGGKAYLQSYAYFYAQPGKSHTIAIAFNFVEAEANCLKFCRYGDSTNAFAFENTGVVNQFKIYSGTSNGSGTVVQSDWNIDPLDGTGPSGLTLDITKANLYMIDFQGLATGRVRMGFNLGGQSVYCHSFAATNTNVHPILQTENLPITVGMTCTGTVSTTMTFLSCKITSEGGPETTVGYDFAQSSGSITAGSGTRTHMLSLRPKLLCNGLTNRTRVGFIELDMVVTGANPIKWELALGQTLSGTTAFNDVNTTYSSTEYNILGTLSGDPIIVAEGGYLGASNQVRSASTQTLTARYPITLDAAGANRPLGTISLLVTGIGGTSACQGTIQFREIR